MIRDSPEIWRRMWDAQSEVPGTYGGRLVMLGTPTYGTFAALEILTGASKFVRTLSALDIMHDLSETVRIFRTFPSLYQLLPSPSHVSSAEVLYDASSWVGPGVTQSVLDAARAYHEALKDTVDLDRMIMVVGDGQATPSGISGWNTVHVPSMIPGEKKIDSCFGLAPVALTFAKSQQGDGNVTHDLSILHNTAHERILPTYYVNENHGDLVLNTHVLASLDELLQSGRSNVLAMNPVGGL